MRLSRIVIASGVTVALIVVWFWTRQGTTYINPTKGETVIAFGDSLVSGVGATPGNNWVSVLSRRVNVPIINAGRNGDTSEDGLSRLGPDVLAKNPRIVLVLLGGNDVLRRIPKQETFKNLATIIDRIHENGAAVILIGVRGKLLLDDYQKEFVKLAKTKRVRYVSDILKGIFGNPSLMYDEIHPNDRGYLRIADKVQPVLLDALYLK